ncbi:unnamed protein product [Amaranthus hypochondriacus]
MVQLVGTGLHILTRIILTQGTFIFSLIVYRHLLAALCIAPFAYYFEKGNGTKLTTTVGIWIFLSSLSGISMGMSLLYYGLRDTSATYAANFLTLLPILTFIFSIITRTEKLNWKSMNGKVKVAGSILCLAGALIISLYKGASLITGNHYFHSPVCMTPKTIKHNWTRGTLLLVASILSSSAWYIFQVKLLKAFPSKYKATMLSCLSASLQAAIIGPCLDTSKTSWVLGWNLQLITIIYSGVLASGLSFCIISYVISRKGPTYPAIFTPLSLTFITAIEVFFLGEDLRIGSLLGMLVIVLGLYLFLWSSNDNKRVESSQPKSHNEDENPAQGNNNELGGLHLSATIVPIASPITIR